MATSCSQSPGRWVQGFAGGEVQGGRRCLFSFRSCFGYHLRNLLWGQGGHRSGVQLLPLMGVLKVPFGLQHIRGAVQRIEEWLYTIWVGCGQGGQGMPYQACVPCTPSPRPTATQPPPNRHPIAGQARRLWRGRPAHCHYESVASHRLSPS